MSAALKAALSQRLAAHAKLQGVTIRPRRLRQSDSRPATTYQVVSLTRPPALDSATALCKARVQCTSWGGGTGPYLSASELADTVRRVLRPGANDDPAVWGTGFSGAIGYKDSAGQQQTLAVQACRCDEEMDLDQPVPTELAADRVDEAVTQDFFIWFTE